MATYLIGYDLRKPGRNYDSLYQAIESYTNWAHLLGSEWAIVTDKPAEDVRNHLLKHIDANDGLTVITARAPGAWSGLSRELTDWLKRNLN